MRQISLSDYKISNKNKGRQHIGLQTELKIIQFKIDCIFLKNQDGGHFINGVHVTFPLLKAILDGMLQLFFLCKAIK